jgi:hypothetical protein
MKTDNYRGLTLRTKRNTRVEHNRRSNKDKEKGYHQRTYIPKEDTYREPNAE